MVPTKQGNPPHGEPVEGRGCREGRRLTGRHHGIAEGNDGGNFEPDKHLTETSANSGAGEGSAGDGVALEPPHLRAILDQRVRDGVHTWKQWLARRSQRARMTWDKFFKLLRRYPLPPPRTVHSILRYAAKP